MIHNLIFDFGAVLVPIEDERTWEAFEDLGARPSLKGLREVFENYEMGKINSEAFLEALQGHFFRRRIFPGDLAKAWQALCYAPIPESSLRLLQKFRRQGYRLFLLSNTNALHIEKIRELSGPFRFRQFFKLFDQVYFSHEMGLRKPNPDIYRKVLSDHNLEAENCFFVDDKKKNVSAAKKLGLNTMRYDPEAADLSSIEARVASLVEGERSAAN